MAVKLSPERAAQIRKSLTSNLWALANFLLDSDNFVEKGLHKIVCRFLTSPGKNKLIVLPRGHLKSSFCSFVFPIWRAIRNPNIRILIVSNSFPNAQKFIRQIRGVFDGNELFRAVFADLLPVGDKQRWSDTSACLTRPREYQESTFEAAGIGTSVISRHYDLIIEDDTIAPKKDKLTENELLPSQEDIEKAIGWHKLAAPLLVNPKSSEILVPTTRWTYYDLINYIKKNDPGYRILDIPAELPDGTLIHPKRFDRQTLDSLKITLGRYFYGALYMNNPVPDEQMTFQPKWFRWFEGAPEYETKRLVIDPAIGESQGACYTAIMLGGFPKNGAIHVDWYKQGHWQEHQIVDEVFTAVREFKPDSVGIEGVLFQRLFKYIFEARMEKENLYFTVDLLDPKQTEKDERIRAAQPLMEYGRIYMRKEQEELIKQLVEFPFGKLKDLLDCLAYLCTYTNPDYQPSARPAPKQAIVMTEDGPKFDADLMLEELVGRRRGGLPFDYQLSGRL